MVADVDSEGDERTGALRAELEALRAELEALRARLAQAEARTTDLVARMAHELRTPLGAISMWAHVLRQGREEDRAAAIDAIEASARSESQLIGRLLDVSRGLAGRLKLGSIPLDLRAPVREALEDHAADASNRGVTLEWSLADVAIPLLGDAGRLREIVSILLSNAIKFTLRGGSVRVTLVRVDALAKLDVADSGAGIAAADIPEIFVPFRVPDERHARAGVGLGVGLALARQLVALHGGAIHCASAGADQGSRFTIELPVAAG
jgi:signal transduction histidine kinase